MRPTKPRLTIDERHMLAARRPKTQPPTDAELIAMMILVGTVLGALLVGVR